MKKGNTKKQNVQLNNKNTVDPKDKILDISNFSDYHTPPRKQIDKSKLFLFVSFDICNSTKLKTDNKNWFEIVYNLIEKRFQAMNFWKFNGDEVIFYSEANSIDYICRTIKSAYRQLKELNAVMSSKKQQVNLKATFWIAKAEPQLHKPKNQTGNNIQVKVNGVEDFVGKHIDEGFRLTKCCSSQKIVIDPKIIMALLEVDYIVTSTKTKFKKDKFINEVLNCVETNPETITLITEILQNTHHLGCVDCKGVWNGNPYPVFWYYEKADKIKYDEYFDGNHIWHKTFDTIDGRTYYNELLEVFDFVDKEKDYKEIRELLHIQGKIEQSVESQPNLYYMVVCFNPASKKVMIARRNNERQHLKGVWDFGNVKYRNVNVTNTICQEYKNTFGIDIELLMDPVREQIKTYGYCTIYRNCRPHNSLLCYAIIKNPNNYSDEDLISQIQEHAESSYDEIRFVTADEVDFVPLTLEEIRADSELNDDTRLGENRCIMYFKNSISDAIVQCTNYLESFNE